MPVSLDLLRESEDLIARGRPEAAVKKLLSVKDETGYKADVLVLSARIGGIDEGEILFVYENFVGERGVCRGVTPATNATTFAVQCLDLIGFDKNGSPDTRIVFQRID